MEPDEAKKLDEPFGRQPQPVKVIFMGDPRDVQYYMSRYISWLEHSSYDVASTAAANSFTIHPRAVND